MRCQDLKRKRVRYGNFEFFDFCFFVLFNSHISFRGCCCQVNICILGVYDGVFSWCQRNIFFVRC